MVFTIRVSSAFDGGNIKYVAQRQNKNDPTMLDVIVHIQPDLYTELEQIAHMQYFSFRVSIGGLEQQPQQQQQQQPSITPSPTTTEPAVVEPEDTGNTNESSNNAEANESSSTPEANNETNNNESSSPTEDAATNNNGGSSTNGTNGNQHGTTNIQKVRYVIQNAHAVSYPEAWSGTTVFYSHDLENVDSWKRNQTTFYQDGKLTWTQEHDKNGPMYFSYFPPYSYSRHLSFLSKCLLEGKNNVQYFSLGESLDGRDIDCLSVGSGTTVCWIIHRQHPGETMAEHYAEGLLTRLLELNNNAEKKEEEDTLLKDVLQMYTFYIVPCMCPDGVVRGHLRTNACGANLNREWANKASQYYEAPTLERSPEVYAVLQKMDETGCDMFLDIHGDEELPYNFISGANNIPHWSKRLEALHGAFTAEYTRSTGGIMQQQIGYPPPTEAHEVLEYMNVATNQVSNRFQCLGVTLEMPFKDCLSKPDPEVGWNPQKSRELGASVLLPLHYIHPFLRTEKEFWNDLPSEDAYVETTDQYQNVIYNVINEEGEQQPQQQPFIMLKKRVYSDVHEIHKRDPHLN